MVMTAPPIPAYSQPFLAPEQSSIQTLIKSDISSLLYAQVLTAYRETTLLEQTIGELRSWASLEENWDGEYAYAPILSSLRQAESFLHLLPAQISVPEPMLNATGKAGFFWNASDVYADLEFQGDWRIAYYVQKSSPEGIIEKHKGITLFNKKDFPELFRVLLAERKPF